jgi:acyl carrier protein
MSKIEFLGHMSDTLELPAGSLTGTERLEDLEAWDSVAMMSFIAFLDENFRMTLSPRQFAGAETLNDLGSLIGVDTSVVSNK